MTGDDNWSGNGNRKWTVSSN